MLIFWKAQVAISLGAGIVAVIVTAVKQETALTVALWSVGAVAFGYFAMLGLFSIFAVMRAPVTLDQQWESEVSRKDAELRQLRTALDRDHPHDKHLELETRSALGKLDENEMGLMMWLLDSGRSSQTDIIQARFHYELPERVIQKTIPFKLLEREIIRSSNGLTEANRFYEITSHLVPIVKAILHPPGPVTPPQE